MKKKILSVALAASLALSCTGIVTAEGEVPSVYVNKSEIMFEDQTPVILGEGTTLIPARGVFEAMKATVKWDAEKRQVEVTSSDRNTIVRLDIDNPTMKVYDMSGMLGSLLAGQTYDAPVEDVTLDVAPQILNDRTMIPLRAISEAIEAKVDWNQAQYRIDITTKNAPASKADCPKLALSSQTASAAAGETFDLYINASNLPTSENTFVSGVSATVKYDKENFEFVEAKLLNGDKEIEGSLGASNAEFRENYVKTAFITINADTAVKADGNVMKVTFKSLNGKKGAFSLSSGYYTKLGYNTQLLVDADGKTVTYEGDTLDIDTAEVVIEGSDAPAATASPEATATPESTASPETTVAPEATASPEATTAPEETAAPTATPAA